MIRYLTFILHKLIGFCRHQRELLRYCKDIESFREKFRDKTVLLYHARLELGPEGWLKVLERQKRQPTMGSILDTTVKRTREENGDRNHHTDRKSPNYF